MDTISWIWNHAKYCAITFSDNVCYFMAFVMSALLHDIPVQVPCPSLSFSDEYDWCSFWKVLQVALELEMVSELDDKIVLLMGIR